MRYLYIFWIIIIFNTSIAQNHFQKLINSPFVITSLSGTQTDGLYAPRDLDFHTDPDRANELWVINENSATFDPNFGGSTVTYYSAGTDSQWPDYRKDS